MLMMLLTSQYKTSPAGIGKTMNIPVKMTGISIMIFFCCGSPVVGVVHCCQTIVIPMIIIIRGIGMPNRTSFSGDERSFTQKAKG